MKRIIGQTLAGAQQPEAWSSCATFVLGFGPLVLLFTLTPAMVHLPACYALAVVCAVLATFLLRAQSRLSRGATFGSSEAGARSEIANQNEICRPILPGREALLSILHRELTPSLPPTLLGVIRIANYDRMAAFEVAVSDRFLDAFYQRLQVALGKTRRLTLVDRNCFAIWFSGAGELEAAKAELQALGYALTQQFRDDAFAIEPELEIGSAATGPQPESPQELISRALASLTKPGARGSAIGAASKVLMTDQRRRFALEQDLRQAIGNGELALEYQPFIDTAKMRVSGAEALLRWSHPQLGLISPLEFIPIIEDTGLMQDVGTWVINSACRQLREWSGLGDADFKMAINLSTQQLQNPELKNIIERTVQNHGLDPSSIEFELTETAAMEDSALTLQLFSGLREAGFGLSIDDFGSGYSSLSYLKNLPFSKLKIDREFVSYVDQSNASRAICKALLELTSGLGISALAEGVGRREEVEALNSMGCNSFQGFYFARPLEPVAFAEMMSNSDWLAELCSPVASMRSELKRRLS
tara:strand:- start:3903 stop:5495 length:1593 start_codon:yes stop_codon:yes gene_type:complete